MAEKLTYTVREYADMLGVHPETVMAWVDEGLIPGEKIRRRYILKKPEIDAWFAGRKEQVA